jgi:uncharacterized cupredoxin-like copper-binding protein
MMKKYFMAIALVALGTTALASGTHEGGHDKVSVAGEPGKKAKVTQTIQVTMKETDDGKMLYMPASVTVKEGQTVRFAIRNAGETDHEFVLDTQEEIMEHKKVMEKFPEMEHDDPNSVRLEPGKSGEIIWKFTKSGTLTFACLIPGHYEAGMHGDVSVTAKK